MPRKEARIVTEGYCSDDQAVELQPRRDEL